MMNDLDDPVMQEKIRDIVIWIGEEVKKGGKLDLTDSNVVLRLGMLGGRAMRMSPMTHTESNVDWKEKCTKLEMEKSKLVSDWSAERDVYTKRLAVFTDSSELPYSVTAAGLEMLSEMNDGETGLPDANGYDHEVIETVFKTMAAKLLKENDE